MVKRQEGARGVHCRVAQLRRGMEAVQHYLWGSSQRWMMMPLFSAGLSVRLVPVVRPIDSRAWLARHLLRLESTARMRRFGGGISDAGVQAYTERWAPAAAFALVDAQGEWRGVVEVVSTGAACAELALSIEADFRGVGWGRALLDAAMEWGRAHGVESMVLSIASHNPAMQTLARHAGAQGPAGQPPSWSNGDWTLGTAA